MKKEAHIIHFKDAKIDKMESELKLGHLTQDEFLDNALGFEIS